MKDKELLRKINSENLGRLMAAGVCGVILLLIGYCNRSNSGAPVAQDAPCKTSVTSARGDSVAAQTVMLNAKSRAR